ncbi:MAG: RagB/SusD family nutrient uptake outer membrane protein [Rikenellaceae bacterium]|nr:RagB/SusD family nutrient uptake outer membrane protein [Rikenellaceae bacterium]
MKRLTYILLAVITFSSCNYLDVEPIGSVIPHTKSDYRALLTSAYGRIPAHKVMLGLPSDEIGGFSEDHENSRGYLFDMTWRSNSASAKEYPYDGFYSTIFYTNDIIAKVSDSDEDGSDESRAQIKAEAYALRAYMHFELLNMYGKWYNAATASTDRGVPIYTQIDIEQHFKPSSVEAVYKQILDDMKHAKELMEVEEQPNTLIYRFSKKSLTAIEARIRLYRNEWQLALDAATSLLPGLQLQDMNALDLTSSTDKALLPYRPTSVETIIAMEQCFEWDTKNTYLTHEIAAKFDQTGGDRRFGNSILKRDGQYMTDKYSDSKNKVTMRASDVYLIAAEAAAHIDGKLNDAKSYLKTVMRNRFTPDAYLAKETEVDGMTQAQLLEEIADERAREFLLEGQRWYDLRRTTRPGIIKTVFVPATGEETTYTLAPNDERYTIPFPLSAVSSNPDLAK